MDLKNINNSPFEQLKQNLLRYFNSKKSKRDALEFTALITLISKTSETENTQDIDLTPSTLTPGSVVAVDLNNKDLTTFTLIYDTAFNMTFANGDIGAKSTVIMTIPIAGSAIVQIPENGAYSGDGSYINNTRTVTFTTTQANQIVLFDINVVPNSSDPSTPDYVIKGTLFPSTTLILSKFTYDQPEGLVAWFDPKDSSNYTLNGSDYSVITNKGTIVGNLSQSTPTLQPAQSTELGFSTMVFTGVGGNGEYLQVPSSTDLFNILHQSDTVSLYTVVKLNSTNPNSYNSLITTFGAGLGPGFNLVLDDRAASSQSNKMFVTIGNGTTNKVTGSTQDNWISDGSAVDDMKIIRLTKQGDSVSILLNEITSETNNTALTYSGNNATSNFTVGARPDGTLPADVTFGDILIYNKILTPEQDIQVRNELRMYTEQTVLIMLGQSQIVGRNATTELTAEQLDAYDEVEIWDGTSFSALDVGTNNQTGAPINENLAQYGPEVEFANTWEATQNRKLYIIKYAKGGTYLAQQGGSDDWNASSTNELADQAVAYINAALATLTKPKILCAIWAQGAADSLTTTDANNYETNLTNLLAKFRAEITNGTNLKFIIPQLHVGLVRPGTTIVRTAQETVANASSNNFLVNIDTVPFIADGVHYNAPDFGRLLFNSISTNTLYV